MQARLASRTTSGIPAGPRLAQHARTQIRAAAISESIRSQDQRERAVHTLGKSYSDLVRGIRGDYHHAPDVIAYPRDEHDVENVLAWCAEQRAAAIPFGGGSSVVRGIEPDVGDAYIGTVSVDLRHLNRVLEVDGASRSALIEGGALGPYLEEQLKPHGLTLRHFPQSFEMSPLGGWIATRSGGHYATLFTHIDEFARACAPSRRAGCTRRVSCGGAGPDPPRLLIGSRGRSGSLPKPGCGCRTDLATARLRRSSSSASRMPATPRARSPRVACARQLPVARPPRALFSGAMTEHAVCCRHSVCRPRPRRLVCACRRAVFFV
jgi:alkyldihydroxyacetonephosphate synthase